MIFQQKMNSAASKSTASAQLLQPTPDLKLKEGWHWYNWIISTPFDLVSTPVYLGATFSLNYVYNRNALGEVNFESNFEWWRVTIVLLMTLILLAIERLEYFWWREQEPWHWSVFYFVLRVSLIQTVTMIKTNEITLFMYLIIPYVALIKFGKLSGIVVGIVAWLTFVSRVVFFPSNSFKLYQPISYVNFFGMCLIFVMMTGYAMLREKASRTRTEGLLEELAKSQLQLEELAATRERNRLARDIHDSLGHYLTVINLLLGKAQAFKERNPPEAERAIEDARRLVNEALEDIRASVRSLRSSQELFSLEKSLPLLVSNLQSENLQIELEVSGSEEGFSKQSLLVLYRVAQEGLTNVQRHAGSSSLKVNLALKFEAEEAKLLVEDDGCGFDLTSLQAEAGKNKNAGYGLVGLGERLEMIGGEFWVESQVGKGTRLVARVCKDKNSTLVRSRNEPAYH